MPRRSKSLSLPPRLSGEEFYYLAGPMTGLPQRNFPLFDRAAAHLRKDGHVIVNPAELHGEEIRKEAYGAVSADQATVRTPEMWREILRRDVSQVLHENCRGIIFLPNWRRSRGARLEFTVAKAFGLPMYLLSESRKGFSLRPLTIQK